MRKHKFRLWHLKKKRMFYDVMIGAKDNLVRYQNNNYWGCFELSDTKIMESTGLNDINGNEIYEGDVVRRLLYTPKGYVSTYLGVIVFHNGSYLLEVKGVKEKETIITSFLSCEIEGNIFENEDEFKNIIINEAQGA